MSTPKISQLREYEKLIEQIESLEKILAQKQQALSQSKKSQQQELQRVFESLKLQQTTKLEEQKRAKDIQAIRQAESHIRQEASTKVAEIVDRYLNSDDFRKFFTALLNHITKNNPDKVDDIKVIGSREAKKRIPEIKIEEPQNDNNKYTLRVNVDRKVYILDFEKLSRKLEDKVMQKVFAGASSSILNLN